MTTLFDEIRERVTTALGFTRLDDILTQKQKYHLFKLYYFSNGLYSPSARQLYEVDTWAPDMASLRTPVQRAVEFYVAHIWAGALPKALPIQTDNDRIVTPIQLVWQWSNWGAKKQLAARWTALYGDLFLKISQRPDTRRPYFQIIEPQYVTEFETDERGVIEYIRIDTPQTDERGDGYMTTEVWDAEVRTMSQWDHRRDESTDVDDLGTPTRTMPLTQAGIDFIPFVWAPFRDVGEERGANCFIHALDKIDEANLLATRLHQMLFRHSGVTWALRANAMDADGKPLPPPRIGNAGAGESGDEVTLGQDRMVRLPGQSSLETLVPPLPYADALAVLNAHMLELEKDLPELAWYRLREMGGDLSGRAVRLLLSDAIQRALEARGSMEAALVRADAMALTMGAAAQLPEFAGIGSYEAGDFEHSFAEREVIPVSETERAETVKALVDASMPLTTAMRRAGYSEAEIVQMQQDKQTDAASSQAALGTSLTAAMRQFDAGQSAGA